MPRSLATNQRSSRRLSKRDSVLVDAEGWQVIPKASLMQSHQPSNTESRKPDPIAGDHRRTHKSSSSARTKYDHIPRPKNSFFFFRSHFLAAQRLINHYQSQNETSKQAGIVWNALSPEDKDPWVLRAEQERIEHQARYPGYVYAPGGRTRSKPKARTGYVSRSRSKRVPPVRSDSEELDSFPSSSYPTRLSPESESECADSHTREASLVPQIPSHDGEAAQPKLVINSEVSSPVYSSWAIVPTEDITLELSTPKTEKPLAPDFSLRPPSYDFIDEPLGVRPVVMPMMDMFLSSMPLPSHKPDIKTEYDLFTRAMEPSTISAAAPTTVHVGCDIGQQIMASYDCDHDYINHGRPYVFESEHNDTFEMLGVPSVLNVEIPVSPVIRASLISQAEEVEMSQYVDFDYEG